MVTALALATFANAVGRLIGENIASAAFLGALAFGAIASLLHLPVPRSSWQIPKSWSRHGRLTYVALFGTFLGLSFATVMPGFGLLALAGFALDSNLAAVVLVVVVYAAVRLAGVLAFATGRAASGSGWQVAEALTRAGNRIQVVEPALLVALLVITVISLAG